MNKEEFIKALKEINIEITDKELTMLEIYYNLLVTWNEKMNLTGITDHDEVYLKHFYDSLTLSKVIDLNNKTLCDIGTGAGFPGLVLKIIFSSLKVTLVDSLGKRCIFLKEVIKELNLQDIEVINDRAEIYSKKDREKYDIVTSRAVAHLRELIEYSVPLVKVGGYFLPMKASINEELHESKNAMKELSITLEKKIEFSLPKNSGNRTILVLQKMLKTREIFPREYKVMKNKPL